MKERVKSTFEGFLISLQFFSLIPIRTAFALDSLRLKRSIQFLPLVGLLFGFVTAILVYFLQQFHFSSFAIALALLTTSIFLSGGMHLDGWMDMSDAYFSYRSIEKRQEIMKDPRVGAFAVMSLLFLLTWRFLFIFETVERVTVTSYLFILFFPFLSRTVMGFLFIYGRVAREEGLAYLFQQGLNRKSGRIYLFYIGLIVIVLSYSMNRFIPYFLLLCGMGVLSGLFLYRFYHKHFGGITGDLLGASVEGVENGLWLVTWLLHLFVMG